MTGGSAGIGAVVADRLAAEGARVVVVSRSGSAPSGCSGVVADLAVAGAPERAVQAAVERLGGLDILVNNVGVAHQVAFAELRDDDWQASFDLNLMSYVRSIRAALPALRASDQPRIVNVSSSAGKRPSAAMPDYSVMKAAVLSLSRLIADVEAGNGVLCNAVCPGPARTPAWLAAGGLADQAAERAGTDRSTVLQKVGAGRPLGRLADPDEIASVIVFLCSARASYVTGAAWSADGGTVPIIL